MLVRTALRLAGPVLLTRTRARANMEAGSIKNVRQQEKAVKTRRANGDVSAQTDVG